MKYFLLLLPFSLAMDHNWHAFACKDPPTSFTDDTWAFFNYTSHSFELQECPSGYTCQMSTIPYALGNYTCASFTPQALPKYPGELCIEDDECEYGDCQNGKWYAVDLGGACHSDLECNPGLRCLNDACSPLLNLGDANWTQDYDCKDSLCNNSTCTAYFSLEQGA